MIYVKFYTKGVCRTSATFTTPEIVPLKYSPAQTERRIASRFVFSDDYFFSLAFYSFINSIFINFGNRSFRNFFNCVFNSFHTSSISVIDEGFQCVHPRTKV